MDNLIVKDTRSNCGNLCNRNYCKIFIMIILVCLICLTKVDIVHAELKVDGITSAADFEACGPYNGCIDLAGYRYTIVKDYQKSESGIHYNRVSSVSWPDSTYHNFSKSGYNQMVDSIKSGGDYFKKILANTHVSEADFFDKNYSILVEPLFILYYFESRNNSCDNHNGCYDHRKAKKMTGDAREIGMFIYNRYDLLGGMRSVTYNVPCLAYIPYPNNNSYDSVCSVVPTKDYLDKKSASEKKALYQKYMTIASSNSRYGSTIITANDITTFEVEIIKTDKDTQQKINSDVLIDVYRGDCYNGVNQRYRFSGSKTIKLPKGKYCIVEIVPPDNYEIETDSNGKPQKYNFTINMRTKVNVKNKRQTGSMTIEKYDSDTGDQINGARFAIYYGHGCTGSIFKENIIVNGSRKISNIPTGNYSVKELTAPSNYQISDKVCENIHIDYNRDKSLPFYNKYKNNITIIKKDEKNNIIKSSERQATFKICSDYNCNRVLSTLTTRNGKATSERYTVGTYYIKEEQAPLGYEGKAGVTEVEITHGTNTVEIKNTNMCIVEFNKLKNKNDMVSRLNLYNDLKIKYKFNYNNLLNLSKQTAEEACTTKNIVYKEEKGCLSASISTTENSFSQNDLSNFTEVIKINNGTKESTGYCSVSFKLINNLKDLNRYEFISKYNFNDSIGGEKFKSGLMVLNRKSPEVAKGILTNTCYVFNTVNKNDANFSINYNDYIGELNFNNDQLEINKESIKEETVSEEINLNQNYVKVTKEVYVTYNLKPVYSSIGTGVISNKECNNCKFLGYGFVSNLNQITANDIGVPFSIKLNKLVNKTIETRNQCIYSVKNDIIDEPDPEEEKLNVEFRVININNPFPGRAGLGRKVGSNWCDKYNCDVTNNSIIKKYITDANDSYNKNNRDQSLYTIRLTSETLQKIREYNIKNNYDNYDLECDAVENKCKSKFLRDELKISKNE